MKAVPLGVPAEVIMFLASDSRADASAKPFAKVLDATRKAFVELIAESEDAR